MTTYYAVHMYKLCIHVHTLRPIFKYCLERSHHVSSCQQSSPAWRNLTVWSIERAYIAKVWYNHGLMDTIHLLPFFKRTANQKFMFGVKIVLHGMGFRGMWYVRRKQEYERSDLHAFTCDLMMVNGSCAYVAFSLQGCKQKRTWFLWLYSALC